MSVDAVNLTAWAGVVRTRLPPTDLVNTVLPAGTEVILDGGMYDNYITLDGADSGHPVLMSARSTTDANVSIGIVPKGTGAVLLGPNFPQWFSASGSSTYPTLTVEGALTDIDAKVLGKGLGYLNTTKLFVGSPAVRASIDTRTTVYMRTSTSYPGASAFSPWFAGGIFSGTVASPVDGFFKFEMADTVAGGASGVRIYQNLATGATRGRTTLSAGLNIASLVSANDGDFHVAGALIARAQAGLGGVPGALKGNLFGGNSIVTATNGAGGHVNSLISHEFDTTIGANARVAYHGGVTSILHYDSVVATGHAQRGWIEDAAFVAGSAQNNLSTVGWGIFLAAGSVVGWSGNADTRFIATQPVSADFAGTSRTYELADVVDMTGATLNRAAVITKNMNIDGSGNGGFRVASGVTVQARDGIFAKTAVVATITPLLPNGGGLYSASGVPTVAIDAPPGSGTTATATIATHAAQQILSMTNGGSGYAAGQVLTQTGGTFGTAAQVTVIRVDGTGKVREARVSLAGNYSVLPVGEQTYTGGTGTGMTMALLYTALTITVSGGGTNYPQYPPPVARYSGGTVFRPPVLVVTMTPTQTTLKLNDGKLNVTGIPTSSAGLNSGDLYSNAGVLTVVP